MNGSYGNKKISVFVLAISILLVSCKDIRIPVLGPADSGNKPVDADKLRRIFETMDTYPDLRSAQDACASGIVPSQPLESGHPKGKCANDPLRCLEECRMDNNGQSCYSLANLLDNNAGRADAYSIWLYYRACELRIVSGCTNHAAGLLEQNPGDGQIEKCAADTFEKTCALDDAWGCASYSAALSAGQGREVDLEASVAAARKACKYEDAPACNEAKKLIELIERKQKLPASTP